MKKSLISSLKFFCLSEMKFLLRFNSFTWFLYTSSVIISLEFVFLNFRLTVGEDLLPLSVQKSPTLLVINVLLQTSFHNMSPCSLNNGSPRSCGHRRRRVTNRQAFSLGMMDMCSVCLVEHVFERGVIVIHILEEPLLGAVARSGTLSRTQRKSPWGRRRWAHNLWGGRTRHKTPSPCWRSTQCCHLSSWK